jgi:hypothetical protein
MVVGKGGINTHNSATLMDCNAKNATYRGNIALRQFFFTPFFSISGKENKHITPQRHKVREDKNSTNHFAPWRLCDLNKNIYYTSQPVTPRAGNKQATHVNTYRPYIVDWYPHTHNHSTLFSSIFIFIAIAAARDNPYSRAGYYTIRPPAAKCRGNPP